MTAPLIPGGPQTIADLVSVYDDGAREAIVGISRRLTCGELEAEIDAAAAAFASLGLCPGDRVAVSGPSDCELIVAFLASQRCGLVWVGMNQVLAAPEKLFQIADCGARVVLADAACLAQIERDLPASVRSMVLDGSGPDDWPALVARHLGATRPDVHIDPFALAAIAYTSGTTGRPKGAMHSQHNMLTVSVACHRLIGTGNWESGLRRIIAIPLTILNGMIYGPVGALVGKGTFVCLDRFDILSVAPRVASESVGMIGTSATTVYDLLHHPQLQGKRLGSLRYVFAGGGFVSEDLKAAFRAIYGCELIEDYGLTEAPTSIVAGRADERAAPGSVGRAHPHLEVAALGADQHPLASGEIGEIAVRAKATGDWANVYTPMLGYWHRPDETADTLKGGWLLTGDLGRIDSEGRVYIVGRKKEIILRGGANVYPAEIERLLRADDRVEDAVVMGLPDERLGEIAAAYLQLRVPADQAATVKTDLMAACQAQLARYKVPERWFLVQSIPRNQMRKPIKSELRDGPRTEI